MGEAVRGKGVKGRGALHTVPHLLHGWPTAPGGNGEGKDEEKKCILFHSDQS